MDGTPSLLLPSKPSLAPTRTIWLDVALSSDAPTIFSFKNLAKSQLRGDDNKDVVNTFGGASMNISNQIFTEGVTPPITGNKEESDDEMVQAQKEEALHEEHYGYDHEDSFIDDSDEFDGAEEEEDDELKTDGTEWEIRLEIEGPPHKKRRDDKLKKSKGMKRQKLDKEKEEKKEPSTKDKIKDKKASSASSSSKTEGSKDEVLNEEVAKGLQELKLLADRYLPSATSVTSTGKTKKVFPKELEGPLLRVCTIAKQYSSRGLSQNFMQRLTSILDFPKATLKARFNKLDKLDARMDHLNKEVAKYANEVRFTLASQANFEWNARLIQATHDLIHNYVKLLKEQNIKRSISGEVPLKPDAEVKQYITNAATNLYNSKANHSEIWTKYLLYKKKLKADEKEKNQQVKKTKPSPASVAIDAAAVKS